MTNDCNVCKYLNITEFKQRLDEQQCLHFCTKYNVRVYHYSQNKYAYKLYPCKQCIKENEKC